MITITDPVILLVGAFAVVGILMAIGVKLFLALAVAGLLGFYVYGGTVGLASLVPFKALSNFVLSAVPLFILMGEILLYGGLSDPIYRGVSRWLSWAPGGLLHANIGACALFAAVSGSSPATAATIGSVAIPELKKRGYDKHLTLGSIAAGGTLGILIPPSITMIIYGMVTNTSVGALFIAGVIPGIMLAMLFMIYIAIRVIIKPQLAPKEKGLISIRALGRSFLDLWPLFVLSFIILGGIFGGFATPTEAAAVGVTDSIILALILRTFSFRKLWDALRSAAETTCMVFIVLVGAIILASFLARSGVSIFVGEYLIGCGFSGPVLLVIIYFIYVVLGCFLDPLSIMVLTMPTMLPVLVGFGYDLIWFGVIVVMLSETGMITPPVGLNLFVVQGMSKESLGTVVKGSMPFFFMMLVGIALVSIIPSLALWLPSFMW